MARGLINVGGSGGGLYTTTITTNWVGTSAPYTQDITVQNLTDNDRPIITPVFSTDNNTAIAEKRAWSYVSKIIVTNNKITCTCFETKPAVAINIQIKVV